jgi:nitrogen regulatory protein P-II 1
MKEEIYMNLLVAVLYHEEHLRVLLERFASIDVRGATVIESTGMGRLLASDVPIFSTLTKLLSGSESRVSGYTVFSVIRTDETLEKAVALVHEVVGDMTRPGTGILFVVPVSRAEGIAVPLSDAGTELAGGEHS